MHDGSGIKEKMAVYGSCGSRVGTVEGVEGGSVRLAGSGGRPYVRLDLVGSVGRSVTLRVSRDELKGECHQDAAG
jgi:hypothetical protein